MGRSTTAHPHQPAEAHDGDRGIVIRPAQLVLRCYARRSGRTPGRWVAHCVDLDLWAVGDSSEAARMSLEDAIDGFVQTVIDTDDRPSIAALLTRRAPLRFVLLWHLIRLLGIFLRDGRPPLGSRSFEEAVPFQLVTA